MIKENRYTRELTVPSSAIDVLGHANNVTYLHWVQDVAIEHWNLIATKEQQETLFWVVARHEIDYKRPALEGDELILTTWIGETSPRASKRHTEISRKKDGKIITKVLTVWSPIDRQTKRPTKVNPDDYVAVSSLKVNIPLTCV